MLPEQERQQWLASLSKPETDHLLYDWDGFWSRPSQRAPSGNWRTWLILAGRGFGKTRTGAEWVRESIKDFPLTNVIAATADDARDIMVEGESGILAICPPGERPEYKPSTRRLEWPNGARTLIFTADEPERLRGKQHMRLWCLTGNTRVLMADGTERPLAAVRPCDMVQTRIGPRRVTGQRLTRHDAELWKITTTGGRDIIGTADHPVWVTGRGFLPLGSLTVGMGLCVSSALSGKARNGTAIKTGITTASSGFTWRSGKMPTGRCPEGIMSTTSTETRPTTVSLTLCSLTANTARYMPKRSSARTATLRSRMPEQPWPATRQPVDCECSSARSAAASTTAQAFIHADIVHPSVLKSLGLERLAESSALVNTAPSHTPQRDGGSATARAGVMLAPGNRVSRKFNEPSPARNAVARFIASEAMLDSAVDLARWPSTDAIATVERLPYRADVYDIAVDGAREFFANGVLVHNCDEVASWRYPEAWDQAMFGLRLGSDPRAVVTTTPKPIELVRRLLSDPNTHVTRGSTYENRGNLAPAFFEQIIRRYEGTRIGRQELNAEVLDDIEGALWTHAMIDASRVAAHPDLIRIGVGVDPSGGATEGHDEQGIIVAGLGVDGDGYVLADRSCRLSPDGWGRRVVQAFTDYKADVVFVEKNYGGDMAISTIETAARAMGVSVPLTAVSASRGKVVRAEPVAALYEQGKVHHVGTLDQLEDQMTSYVPGLSGSSPDRMDALVWVATEVLLQGSVGVWTL